MADATMQEIKSQPSTAQQAPASAPAALAASAAAPAASQKKSAAPRKRAAPKSKSVVVKAKRKESTARAYLKPGKGMIRVNGQNINSLEQDYIRKMILEPFEVSSMAKDVANKTDIKVNVKGGGISSQMQAVRGAIAKGIVALSNNEVIKQELMNYDRSMLVDDTRRVEPKKFRGPKARSRFQTSYR